MANASRQVDWRDMKYVQALGEAIRADDTRSEVLAKRLLKKFPEVDVTKHSVIGALNRKHVLASLERLFPGEADTLIARYRSNASHSNGKVVKKKKLSAPRVSTATPKPERMSSTPHPPREYVSVEIPDLKPLLLMGQNGKNNLALSSSVCNFPIGDPKDPDFGFCGRAQAKGKYCADHARLVYQPLKPRKR